MDVADIKKLREATGAGILDSKNALESCNGDYQKAYDMMISKGLAKAAKRETKDALEGSVGSYVHSNGKIGAMVVLNCETDFVAKNDVFQELLKDLCMQVAALNPIAIRREDVSEETIKKLKEMFIEEAAGKPADIIDKIIDGKMNAYYKDNCLLEQSFIKDNEKTIQELLTIATAKTGEKIEISGMGRFGV